MKTAAKQSTAAPAQHQLMRRSAATFSGTKTSPFSIRRKNLYKLTSMPIASAAQA